MSEAENNNTPGVFFSAAGAIEMKMAKEDGFASYLCLTKTMACPSQTKNMSSCLRSGFSSTRLQTINLQRMCCELQKAGERDMAPQYASYLLSACTVP